MPTTIYSDQSQPVKWVVRERTDVSLTLTVTLSAAAYDLTSFTFVAEFFKVGSATAFLTLTQGSGITNGGVAGTIVLAITDTQLTVDPNQYFWRLKTTAPTDNVWFNGVFDVEGYISDVPGSSSATIPLTLGGDSLSVALSVAGSVTLASLGTTLQTAASDTPLDADTFHFWDAVDAILKKVTWSNIKATLKTYFDTLYLPIGEGYFLGYYASLSALQTAYPTAEEGNYAYVDAGIGTDILQYIWDESDGAWIVGGGSGQSDGTTINGDGSGGDPFTIDPDYTESTIQAAQKYTINNIPDADYTVLLSDAVPLVKFIVINASSPRTITLPKDTTAAIPIGQGPIALLNIGNATVTIAAESGATLENYSTVYTVPAGSIATFIKRAANTWRLENITAAVPTSRTIAGISLASDITAAALNAALGAWVKVKITSPVTLSTTAYADITGLLFPITSGTVMEFRGTIFTEAANVSEGYGIDITGPTLDTNGKFFNYHGFSAAATSQDRVSGSYDNSASMAASLGAGSSGIMSFSGKVKTTASGSIQLRGRTESGGINVVVLADSYIEYRAI